MKIERLFIYCLLAGILLFASCSGEGMMDGDSNGTPLPHGMYPLTFTATQGEVVPSPQTRVSDSDVDGQHKSSWTAGDQIRVKVSDNNSYNVETICTLDANGGIISYNPQLYWQTTGNYTIDAWYSNIEGSSVSQLNTVSLANQSSGLAYVLKADQLTNQNYKSGDIALAFKHQLAKVRVKLTGEKASEVTSVGIKSYTSCTHTGGTNVQGSNEGWIAMKECNYTGISTCWEANVVPGHTITEFQLNGSISGKLTTSVTPVAAAVNTITLTVSEEGTVIKGGGTIAEPGNYIIKSNITETVTLNGDGINLTLQNASIAITGKDQPAINITGGSTTLIVKGTNNTLSSSQWGGITISGNASLTIKGYGKDESNLTVTAGNNTNSRVSTVGIGAASNATCGGVLIENVKLTVSGGADWDGDGAGAAIGTSSTNSICGNITINNAHVIANAANASHCSPAAIGLGSPNSNEVKDITISGSIIEATVYGSYWDEFGACIGLCGAVNSAAPTYKCGTITITCDDESAFLANLKSGSGSHTSGYKIGRGHIGSASEWNGTIIFPGGTFNGKAFTDGYGSW